MKRILFTLLMILTTAVGISQTIGEAFYIYRNDGEFNAFLREEVDSISYSYYDVDSLYFEEIVTQVVYTADSTYWIPLSSIDSVSFVTPETKYTPQVVKLEPLLPYIVSVDGMKLTFSSDTPSDLFPQTNDILVLDNFDQEQFPTGFAGKMSQKEGLQITCDSVSFEDIYEQITCYGYFTAINDSNSTENRRVRLIAKKKVGGHFSTSISLTGTLGSREAGLYVAADASLGLDLRFTFKYRKGEPTYFDVSLTPQLSLGLEAGAKGTISKTIEDEEPLFWMPLPDIPFYFKIKGGPSSKFSLSASIVARIEAKLGYKFGIKYKNEKFQWDGKNTTKWSSKPDVTGSINGSIFAGFKLSYGIYSYGDIISTTIEKKAGIEFEASITDSIKNPNSLSYDELKDNYLDVNLKASAAFKAEAKLFRWLKLSAKYDIFSGKINVFKFRLVPSFTKPIVTLDKTSANVSVVPDDHLLLSVFLGLGLWDDNNSLSSVQYCDIPYTDRKSWLLDEFSTTFANLSLNKDYTVRPLVKFFGATIVAPPEESFKISIFPITLDVYDIEEYSAKVYGKIEGLELLNEEPEYGIGIRSALGEETTYYKAMNTYDSGEYSVDLAELKPNTKYIYFAYLDIDGQRILGEEKEFTTTNFENAKAYAILNDSTLTFYYDGKQKKRVGRVFNISTFYNKYHNFSSWFDEVRIIDFDPSFYYYKPTDTSYWFNLFHHLVEIRNIKWLNTSKTTMMEWMFANCNSLKSLDFRSFDTSNVKSMHCMFSGCSSLTYLDISSFDTWKVTKMGYMFSSCRSLTSIDVSSLNTVNVTEMDGMFYDCSSIKILDLSHFIITKDTDVKTMFRGCSSLTTIYAGNWNARSSEYMFLLCDNLRGGRGTKVGVNYYIDENGVQRSYNCYDSGWAAHIDGGKDWPGLFTAK